MKALDELAPMSQVEYFIGDFCKVCPVPDSNIVLFAFSGANLPAKKFNYTGEFKNLKVNVVFLNDSWNTYYQKGIQGLGNTLDETISLLNAVIDRHTCATPEIYTFGCSMGGYGALLYGSLLNATKILGFGAAFPPYSTSLRGTQFYNDAVKSYDLLKDRIKLDTSCKVLYYGDRGVTDICSFNEARNFLNVSREIYKGSCHALVYTISQLGSLKNVITRFVNNEVLLFSDKKLIAYSELLFLREYSVFQKKYFNNQNEPFEFLDVSEVGAWSTGMLSAYIELVPKDRCSYEELKFLILNLLSRSINISVLDLALLYIKGDDRKELFKVLIRTIYSDSSLLGYDFIEKLRISDAFMELYKTIGSTHQKISFMGVSGYYDGYDSSSLKGWLQSDNGFASLNVYMNGLRLGDFLCDVYRADLESANLGYLGDGKCAFEYYLDISRLYLEATVRPLIEISFQDIKAPSCVVSNFYVCPPLLISSIRSNSDGIVTGWVYDSAYLERFVPLDVYIDGKFSKSIIADEYFGDLDRSKVRSNSGFSLNFHDNINDTEACNIQIFSLGTYKVFDFYVSRDCK